MSTNGLRKWMLALCVVFSAFSFVFYGPARAEDTDIFTVNPSIVAQRPNVLIMLDNTANWNTAFSVEKSALVTTVNGLDDRFNVGLAAFVETGSPNDNVDGAYIRAAVRQMTLTNKTAMSNLVNNLDITFDKSNNATFGLAMAEIYRYFGGLASSSGFGKAKRDYSNNTMSTGGNTANNNPGLAFSNALWARPGNAFSSAASSTYVSPITDDCANNFVIFISNGPANDNNSATTSATTALAGFGGSTAAIALSPNGSQSNVADEWARFMANSDVNSARAGTQKVVTYTIDVNPGTTGQGPAHTALLKSMATQGQGRYFAVSSSGGGTEIADALNKIFQEVLATNSVFASATLPVSVNTRGTFLNQVYMGVFRPDGGGAPRWPGNLKQYKTFPNSAGDLVLVDSTTLPANPDGVAVEDTANGFIKPGITSFWSTSSSFWDAAYYPDAQGQGLTSDAPDGDLVEKGGAAQRLRSTYATNVTTRKLYTCTGTCGTGVAGANYLFANYPFDSTNASLAALAPADFGLSSIIDVTSVIRSGNTATVTTTTDSNFSVGQSITLSGATQSAYNGVFTVLASPVPTARVFAVTVTESPAFPATGTITLSRPGGAAFTLTSLIRAASNDATGTLYTDTATGTSAGHGLLVGDSVTIQNVTPPEYNGTFIVLTAGANQFTYAVPVSPALPTTLGSATGGSSKTISALTRAGRLVTVTTTANHGFSTGDTIAITGMTPAAYDGSYLITKTGNRIFTYSLTSLSPLAAATTATSIMGSKTAAALPTTTSLTRTALGSTTATLTTAAPHGLSAGQTIVVSGATQSAYNGTFTVLAAPSTTSLTYTVPVTPVSPATGTIKAQATSSVTNAELIRWVRGENTKLEDNASNVATNVRAYLHGDVVHSRPAIINYNRPSVTATNPDGDVVVFYGSNDGIFHAVKGGQASTDGYELWGFVAPEHFQGLGRQYSELPTINNAVAATTKPYFADGSVATLTIDANNDGVINSATSGDAAYIYVTMRRGGRFIYAMDVTDPAAPKLMWKISNTSSSAFAELGQTWSEPKVTKIKGYPNYVLIISAGYDAAANDVAPQGTATMGRGVYVVDAISGAPLWYAGANNTVAGLVAGTSVTGKTTAGGAAATLTGGSTISTMKYAIAADASPIDSDGDGYVDRFYLADTGGNIWRANTSALNADGTTNFSGWTMTKLAALGLDSGAECATSTTPCRKFLFAPDVVQFDSTTDSVLLGSGDREQPFEVATQNRFFMLKDSHTLTATPAATIVQANLYDATADLVQVGSAAQKTAAKSSLSSSAGWSVNLGVTAASPTGSAGEKVVTKAVTVNGSTVFGTNVPDSQISSAGGNTCSAGLGEARLWSLNYKDASSLLDSNADGILTTSDRFMVRAGGGLPPSPIAITVKINDKIYEGIGSGATIVKVPKSTLGKRTVIYWNMLTEPH